MMTTVSLSGIATHDASFAFFKSAEVETVAIFFMLICSLNFALHFVAWRRKSLLAYWRSTEARCCLAAFLMLAAGTAFAALLHPALIQNHWKHFAQHSLP